MNILYDARMSVKRNPLGEDLARMLKGGVIMDVVTAKQAKLAEKAGACAQRLVDIQPRLYGACGSPKLALLQ